MIYIISPKDKINNYAYEEYIKIFDYCYYLFQIEKEQCIEIYIENNFILTEQSITYIIDILKENNINQIKKMQIFTINEAIEYLHISKKTLYSLNNKKILLMNITPMNHRYYTQMQLNEYIQQFCKINDNYFTITETAKYLNTTINKILLLKYTRELYPLIINDEEYYTKDQLELIQTNKVLDQYLTITEILQYCNISRATLRRWINKKLINCININQTIYINKNNLPKIMLIKNTSISARQAAIYLNISDERFKRLLKLNILQPANINKSERFYYFSLDYLNTFYINNNKLYTAEQVKNILQISNDEINKLCNIQYIYYFYINQNIYFIKSSIDDYRLKLLDAQKKSKKINLIKKPKLIIKIHKNVYYNRQYIIQYLHISANTISYSIRKQKLQYIIYNDIQYFEENNIRLYFIQKIYTCMQTILTKKNINEKQQYKYNIMNTYLTSNQATKYLNISTSTLRKLTGNNIINYMYFNHKYLYKLEDLKKYKLQMNELDTKYFTINQVIEYLKQYNIIYSNTTIYSKFNITIINNKYYFEKNQIFEYVQQYNQLYNDLQTDYYNTKQVANLLSIHANLLSAWNKSQLLIPDYVNSITYGRFYLKTTIIDFINKMINNNQQIGNNIYYTANQAAKYLNININSILEYKNNKLIPDISIDNNYFYSKKQLDQYLLMQQNFMTDYLNTKQAIQYLNIPISKFFKYIRKYNISADKIYNNEKYYLKDVIYELRQLIDNENNTYDNEMTETDAMQYLNISRGTIQKLVKLGKLTAYAKDHSHKYYIKKQLDEYKEENNLNNYYTMRQVANLLQFEYRILLYRINKNELPFNIKIINSRKYIIRAEVDEYLKNNV